MNLIFHLEVQSIIQCCLSVNLSIGLKLEIMVTAKPSGLYSSGNIPTGPAVSLSYILGSLDTPPS